MTPREKVSVYLVAGNRLLREALARILNKTGNFDVRGVTPLVPELSPCVADLDTDVLILDALSVELSDYAFLHDIATRAPGVKIVLIDMDGDPETFLKCVRAGVVGYLLQDASAADVVSGVQAVARGEAVCPPQLSMHLFRTVARQWTALPSAHIRIQLGLTRRQQQLVPLIARGFTNKEIACHLNISEQTVKNHIHRMLRRVGASDRLQVIDMTRSLAAVP